MLSLLSYTTTFAANDLSHSLQLAFLNHSSSCLHNLILPHHSSCLHTCLNCLHCCRLQAGHAILLSVVAVHAFCRLKAVHDILSVRGRTHRQIHTCSFHLSLHLFHLLLHFCLNRQSLHTIAVGYRPNTPLESLLWLLAVGYSIIFKLDSLCCRLKAEHAVDFFVFSSSNYILINRSHVACFNHFHSVSGQRHRTLFINRLLRHHSHSVVGSSQSVLLAHLSSNA